MSHHKQRCRVDQLLSSFGYCTRSEARAWLRDGRVTLNGEPVESTSDKVAPGEVLIDGQPVECPDGLLALFHKPAGYVCSHDTREGPNIYGLLPPQWSRRNPPVTSIGRLDKDTTGVLLITDVGALVQRWTSPKHKVPKIYEVTVDRDLEPRLVETFAAGTLLLPEEEKACAPATLEIVSAREARLELTEGKYHQVKRMFSSQGFEVTRLHRSRFGEYVLGELKPGAWQILALPKDGTG